MATRWHTSGQRLQCADSWLGVRIDTQLARSIRRRALRPSVVRGASRSSVARAHADEDVTVAGAYDPVRIEADVAEEPQPGGAREDAHHVQVVMNAHVRALAGDPKYQFGQVGWVEVDSRGRIFVLDEHAQHIQVYAADGVYEQTVGGRGSGPGELQSAQLLAMGRGDTLLVPDVRNLRFNRYAPDGSSVGSFRFELSDGLPMWFRTTSSGVIAEQIRPFALPGEPAPEDSMDAIVLIGTDAAVMDTLMTFPSGQTYATGGTTPEIRVYYPEPAWDLSDDMELLFGVNDEYRIELYSAAGKLDRIITKPGERKAVSGRDRDAVMTSIERVWKQRGVPPERVPELRRMCHFSDVFPAFQTILSGPAGSIWVQHVQAPSELSEEEFAVWNVREDWGAPEWDVFDAQGRFLGIVTMPRRFSPRIFRGDKIYGVWRDELDVQYVLRLRVVGDFATRAM